MLATQVAGRVLQLSKTEDRGSAIAVVDSLREDMFHLGARLCKNLLGGVSGYGRRAIRKPGSRCSCRNESLLEDGIGLSGSRDQRQQGRDQHKEHYPAPLGDHAAKSETAICPVIETIPVSPAL